MDKTVESNAKSSDVKARGLLAVIKAAGSKAELARKLEISKTTVGNWHQIPSERLIQIEAVIGVPREIQRPDLYRSVA